MSDINGDNMFKRLKDDTYLLNEEECSKIYASVKEYLDPIKSGTNINNDIFKDSLKNIICLKIAILANERLQERLIKVGLVVVKFAASDLGLSVTVGLIDDELVYGELIK